MDDENQPENKEEPKHKEEKYTNIRHIVEESINKQNEKIRNTYLITIHEPENYEKLLDHIENLKEYRIIKEPIEFDETRIIPIKSEDNKEGTIRALEEIVQKYNAVIEPIREYRTNTETKEIKTNEIKNTIAQDKSGNIGKIYK